MLFLLDNSMAIIWWLDYIKCNLLIALCISIVITNSIALKCLSCSNHKLWTELSFQVFIVYLFPYCLKILENKLLDGSHIKFVYRTGHAPF